MNHPPPPEIYPAIWTPDYPIQDTLDGPVKAYTIRWAFIPAVGTFVPDCVQWALFEVLDEELYVGRNEPTTDLDDAIPACIGVVAADGATQWWIHGRNPEYNCNDKTQFHAFIMALAKARHRGIAFLREQGVRITEPDQSVEVEVVCALIRGPDGTLLMQKRPDGKTREGQWEWPGGKVEKGEDPRAALIRELTEELGPEFEATAVIGQVFQEVLQLEVSLRLTGYDVALPKALALKIAQMDGWIGAEGQEVEWIGVNRAILQLPCTYGTYRAYPDVLRWMQRRAAGR